MNKILILLAGTLLIALGSCTISETYTYDKNFNGTKVIEFELENAGFGPYDKDALESQKNKIKADSTMDDKDKLKAILTLNMLKNYGMDEKDLNTIDSIFNLIGNIKNYKFEKVNSKYLKIKYDFTAGDLDIIDKERYDSLVARLNDNIRWYFIYNPNKITILDKNRVLWRILDIDLFKIDFITYEKVTGDVGDKSFLITKSFERKIKSVSNPDIFISSDRHTLKTKVKLSDVMDFKFNNETIIEFE